MGPWSSWLTQFEAKRRFPHAEEIAGSNPAGPTTNHFVGSPSSEVFPYFLRSLIQVSSFWPSEAMVPNHCPQGSGDGVPTKSRYNMKVKMHHHLASSLPVKLNNTYAIGANGRLHSSTDSLNHHSQISQYLFGNLIDVLPMTTGNNQSVTNIGGVQVHECQHSGIFVNDACWRFAGGYATEWTNSTQRFSTLI